VAEFSTRPNGSRSVQALLARQSGASADDLSDWESLNQRHASDAGQAGASRKPL